MNARIVFDLDGTLIDSAPDIQNIANASLSKIDVAQISEFTERVATMMNSITARTDLCGVVL